VKRVLYLFIAFAALLAGCSAASPKSHFYSLTPLAAGNAGVRSGASGVFSLGIAPAVLPDYLSRPQMIVRRGNELQLAEYHRWGGSLEEEFSRVLAENLSALLDSPQVATYPWAANFSPDYRLAVDLVRFDGNPEEGVTLVCRWSVAEGGTKNLLLVEKASIVQPVAAEGFSALAGAHSLALEQLSRQIASGLSALRGAGSR